MPTRLPRPNAGMPWTPEETGALRRLAAEGVALDKIAQQLGRSFESVSERARRAGIVLDHARIAVAAGRAEVPSTSARAGTRAPQAGWAFEAPSAQRYYTGSG